MISNKLKVVNLNNTSSGRSLTITSKHEDLSIDDLIAPLNRLQNATGSYKEEAVDILICYKLCFDDEYSLYKLLDKNLKQQIDNVLANNFLFFQKCMTSKEDKANRDFLYSLIYHNNEVMKNHFVYINSSLLNKKILLADFKSLYFGSRIFNKLSEHSKCDIKNYVERIHTLFFNFIKSNRNNHNGEFLLDFLKLNNSMVFDTCFLSTNSDSDEPPTFFHDKDTFDKLFIENLYEPSITIVKKKLIFSIALLLNKVGSEANLSTMIYVLKKMNPQYLENNKVIASFGNEYFLVAYLKSCTPKGVKRIMVTLIMKWANNSEVDASDSYDLLLTKLILQCCNILSDVDFEAEFASKTFFVNGISKRLMNPRHEFVERTMLISKKLTNNKIEFDNKLHIELLYDVKDDENIDFTLLNYSTPQTSLQKPVAKKEVTIPKNEVSTPELTNDVNKRIYFIKDFIKQLLSISSQSSNNLNIAEVLNEGCKIMEIKINSGNYKEIDFYIADLLPLLINLKARTESEEKLPIENFRIRALVSVIKSNPEISFQTILEYLFTKDLNIQTRLSLLTSVGLVCLEINKFESPLKAEENVESQVDEMLLHERLIKKSITTWRSKKLDNTNEDSNSRTRYYKQKNTNETLKVCYALVNGWESGINLAPPYDKIFKEHYLKLLIFVYGIVSDYKHLDSSSELSNKVKMIIVDGYKQDILLEKDIIASMF